MPEAESTGELPAMGWLPDWPDYRDYVPETEQVAPQLEKADVAEPVGAPPSKVDLRKWFPPVENRGSLGSCTANAGVGVVEYFERRAHGKHLDASRLFLYKATRNLLGWIQGNLAAGLQSMLGFTVYASMTQASRAGRIPLPGPGEGVSGGHVAVVAAGDDDSIKIKNAPNRPETTGALLIRNSGVGTRGRPDGPRRRAVP